MNIKINRLIFCVCYIYWFSYKYIIYIPKIRTLYSCSKY